jgi:phage recombination protein Bet
MAQQPTPVRHVMEQPAPSSTALTAVAAPELPPAVVRRGISDAQWRTLCRSLYPGADPQSVLMVWDYCLARKLDPLKKPCHIVPMEVKKADGSYEWRDVVMAGIYEYRTTAQRTGQYLGHTKPEYGPEATVFGVAAPQWCDLTVYRWNADADKQAEFPVRCFFKEVVALKNGKANTRWSRAPIQMLTKCAEAAALREAFPDELGGTMTEEEMEGQRAIDAPVVDSKTLPVKPEGYDDWLDDLCAVADEGLDRLEQTFRDSSAAYCAYLTACNTTTWDTLKARARAVTEGTPDA